MPNLEQKLAELELQLAGLARLVMKGNFSDNEVHDKLQIFNGGVRFADGRSISFSGNGASIGSSASDKVSFHGATPVVQAAAIATPSGGVTQDAEARAAITSIITALHNKGLIG